MQKILITGGNGLIGNKIQEILNTLSIEYHILTRSPKKENEYFWDIPNFKIDLNAFKGVDSIIHLAGSGVADHRWSEAYKKEIIESRTKSTQLLYNTIVENNFNIRQYTGASAIGYYGDSSNIKLHEESSCGDDFLSTTCQQWEDAHLKFSTVCNVSIIRIGLVISKNGGAFPKLLLPTKFGIVPIMGDGQQIMSWIHINDIARIIFFATQKKWQGIFNGVAPHPVSHKEFMLKLKKKNRAFTMSVPKSAIAALMGEQADMIFFSQNASSEKIIAQGYDFLFPTLDTALKDLL